MLHNLGGTIDTRDFLPCEAPPFLYTAQKNVDVFGAFFPTNGMQAIVYIILFW